MSARNKFVGIGGLKDGLVLVPSAPGQLFQVPISEAGLRQATMRFATFDPGQFAPSRKTKCTDFVTTSEGTQRVLALFPYLAAQSSNIIVKPHGAHYVDVLCQGAIFNVTPGDAPVVAVAIANRGEYTVLPSVVFSGGDEVNPAHAVARLQRKALTIESAGAFYVEGDILTLVGGTFETPVKVIVDAVDVGGAITGFHTLSVGNYTVVPAGEIVTTGGSGGGATFTAKWCLREIIVESGGLYANTPTAQLVGAATRRGELGAVTMGAAQPIIGGDTGSITEPFNPVTTVKDTLEFSIVAPNQTQTTPPPGGGGGRVITARVAVPSLPYPYIVDPESGPGHIRMDIPANVPGILFDGVSLNYGDKILLNDGTATAGLYTSGSRRTNVPFPHGAIPPSWIVFSRAAEMDESSEVNNDTQIAVAEGSNAGLWDCTNTGSVVMESTPITFSPAGSEGGGGNGDPGQVTLQLQDKITIEYHAIELTYEYVAKEFASGPRFLQDEYIIDENDEILIDIINDLRMKLDIDSVSAIEQKATVDSDGNVVGTVDGPPVAIDKATWRNAIKFVGTAAEFEQTPAGAYWHIKETCTIKIVPITAAGNVGEPGS